MSYRRAGAKDFAALCSGPLGLGLVIYLVAMRAKTVKLFFIFKFVFVPILLLLVLRCAVNAQMAGADEEQIRGVLQKYATSVDNADVALAAEIWSHDPGVTFIHPLGTEHGFKQIADDVYIGIMGNMFSKRELILRQPAVHIYGDAAWAEMTWTFHATTQAGPEITTEGRETQVYHREDGVWRIVLVHYSGPPTAMPSRPGGF
jgi:ketosteroid isomerase-like protein